MFLRLYVIFFFLIAFLFNWIFPDFPIGLSLWLALHLFAYLLWSFLNHQHEKSMEANAPSKQGLKAFDHDKLLATLFQHLDPMIILVDQEGEIVQMTSSWRKIFSIQELTVINMNRLREAATLWSAVNQGIATEKSAQFQWDYKNRHYESTLSPLFLNQQFYGVVVTAVDITKVSQLEKIQSDFLADISHEIKTPLAAILGASEILNQTSRKLSIQETKEFQAMIASESARLQRLILELTDLSKIGSQGFQMLVKTKFSLHELINEIKKIYLIEIQKKHIDLKVEIPPNLDIFADRDKFFLIMSNLLSNAIRYTDQGIIAIKAEVKKQNLIFEVKDSGQGIEPQNLERIFDRFYRTDMARSRNGGGTGLGLAITRAIIQAHQGTIKVTSEVQKGTTFTITLPHPLKP
jgi:two-component system, OmpR family, phosphate regulon sensor histidine kinase PhoR